MISVFYKLFVKEDSLVSLLIRSGQSFGRYWTITVGYKTSAVNTLQTYIDFIQPRQVFSMFYFIIISKLFLYLFLFFMLLKNNMKKTHLKNAVVLCQLPVNHHNFRLFDRLNWDPHMAY